MPSLNLSLVTESLIRLLERYLAQKARFVGLVDEIPIAVSGYPPDEFAEQQDPYALNLYLYQIQEDEYHKNLPDPSGNDSPCFREMGLNLFYLLSAHANRPETSAPFMADYANEQLLMGLAVKAFHDYPVLDAGIHISGLEGTVYESDTSVFPTGLQESRDLLRLTLHPASMDDLNKVWTAASTPMRLSAIYQVGVILMPAEKPQVAPIPVLARHLDSGISAPLHVERTESDLEIRLADDTEVRTRPRSPAQVPVGGVIRIMGEGFASAETRVLIGRPGWSNPAYRDITEWVGRRTDTRIDLLVGSTAGSGGPAILPGLYHIHVRRGGAGSDFTSIAIAPVIAPPDDVTPAVNPGAAPPGGGFRVHGGPFADDARDITSLEAYLGEHRVPVTASATEPGRADVGIPADMEPGTYLLRVLVNGVSAAPSHWFEVTAP